MNPIGFNSDERVLVILDLRNVSKFLADNTDRNLSDYNMLLDGVLMGRRCIEAIAFDSLVYEDGEDSCRKFHDKIRSTGFRLELVGATNRAGKMGIVDVNLAVFVMEYIQHKDVDVVELISGDGDLVPLVHALHRHGIKVNASAFKACLSPALKDCTNSVKCLDSIPMIKVSETSNMSDERSTPAVTIAKVVMA